MRDSANADVSRNNWSYKNSGWGFTYGFILTLGESREDEKMTCVCTR